MRNLTLFSMVFAVSFVVAGLMSVGAAKAQKPDSYDFTGYEKMTGAKVKELFAGRTFWGRSQYDRYYFGADGSFAEQYVKADSPVTPGTTYTGKWNVDGDGAVCWTYEGVNTTGTIALPQGACYDVYMGPDKFKPLPKYTDPLYIVKKGDTSKTTAEFFWNRYIDGRVILETSFAQNFEQTLASLASIEQKFAESVAAGQTTPAVDPSKPLTADMQEYYNMVAGNVFYTPYHFLYFAKNGDYIFYNRGDFDMNRGDLAALTAKAKKGRWIIHENAHCWAFNKKESACQYVAKGATLDYAFEGFVTHVDDGFTRLINGKPVGVMSLEQTGLPAAFTSVSAQ